MIEYLLLGSGFAFAAAVQPGPLQAFLLAQVTVRGWRRTLPAAFAPLLSDGPIALIAVAVLGRLSPAAQQFLRFAGGLLLLFFAWTTFRQSRSATPEPRETGSAPRTLFQAVLVNLLNPNPYLAWALVLGPALLSAWRREPALALSLLAAFYGTMVVTLGAIILAFGTSHFLGPRSRTVLQALSVAALGLLGAYQLFAALSGRAI